MKRRTTLTLALGGLAAPTLLLRDATAQSPRDGILRIANAVELDTLDPHAVLDTGG
jgi:hypothetical protein